MRVWAVGLVRRRRRWARDPSWRLSGKPLTSPLKKALRRLPAPLYRRLRWAYLRLTARPAPGPAWQNPGPLLRVVATRVARIPGWFNLDDLSHFTLVLETQRTSGLSGDLLEVGCYHGRSGAVLAMHLQEGERLVLIDAFDLPLSEPYGDTPSAAGVLRNLRSAVPDLDEGRLHILKGYSREVQLPPGLRVRFAHVDGGHDRSTVRTDLGLCASVLIDGGVIAVDDYAHPEHQGVSEGVADFLRADSSFRVLADVNRAGALGRKLYLGRDRDRMASGAGPSLTTSR